MEELTGPVIGITLVLTAVFLPAAFMPGITGQLFRQFALVIASTAIISALNALTLKPAQCALWLRPHVKKEPNFFYRGFNRGYGVVEHAYVVLIQLDGRAHHPHGAGVHCRHRPGRLAVYPAAHRVSAHGRPGLRHGRSPGCPKAPPNPGSNGPRTR